MKKFTYFLLLFYLIASSTFCADSMNFKFAVWGDSQFHNPETFEEIVRETELLKPEFVVHVGDMIHGYTYDPEKTGREWDRFKKQISPLSAPFYPTPGNHDVTTPEIEPVYGEVWGENRYYYSFDASGVHFIVLDNFYRQNWDTVAGEQLEWLKKDLEANQNAEHIFLSMHAPLHLTKEKEWNQIHEILKKYPVRAVFTGHSHIYDHRIIDDIRYFCLNSSGRMTFYNHFLGRSHHFLVASVKEKRVHYAILTDGSIYPPDAVPPGEYKKASDYLRDEQTIIIPNTQKGPVKTTARVSIKNESPEKRKYIVDWETEDYRWNFSPWGKDFYLEPGMEKSVVFDISGPQGRFARNNLPALKVISPWISSNGYSTELSYIYRVFSPPETEAVPLEGAFEIDGRMDDKAWKQVPAITQLFVDTSGTTAPEKNIIKVIYDKENLYVGMWGEEPNPAGLSAFAHGEVPFVFGDDDFEIYLDTNRDLETFYRLMTNPKRVTLCSGPGGLFSFDFKVRTYVGDACWSAEFRIPFREINTEPPEEGDIWGFNVRRHRQQADPAQRDWSKMRNFPYQPPYFGLLRFQ